MTRNHIFSPICLLPWILTVAFAVISLLLLIELHRPPQLGTYETDSETDFPFPSHIPLQKVRVCGSPHSYSNGSPWVEQPDKMASWPQNLQYGGEPTATVDRNLQRLIWQRYFSLSEEEAQRAWGERRHEYVD
ncbi:hypothetical protein DV736_g3768, partial [Chaetothyriales sp. CBS 134916]